jgi:putative MATE family efflux protein
MASELQAAELTAAGVDLSEARLPRTVLSLAWPALVEELGIALLGIVDTILVGQLIGSDALAGVGLGVLLLSLPLAGSLAIAIGATAVVARDAGAGELSRLNQVLRDIVFLASAWGLMTSLAAALLAEPALRVMGAESDVLPLGTTFMQAGAAALFFQSLTLGGNAAIRGIGDTRTPMLITVAINLINVVLAYVLISGFWIAPEMGVLGSGLAFSIANGFGAAIVLVLLLRGKGILRYRPEGRALASWTGMQRVLAVGGPAGVEQIQFQIAFILYARIISGLGTTAYAAHTVALRAEMLAIMPGFAFGVAAATLVGQALGAARPQAAERATRLSHYYALVLMAAMGLVLLALAPQVSRVFTSDSDVIDTGADLLRIFAFALPGLGTSAALAGGLRGAGDTRAVMTIYTGSAWLLRLPFAFLFAIALGLGAQGAWLGSVVDNSVRGIAMWARFRQGKWKEIEI